jgi:hypothetical protein
MQIRHHSIAQISVNVYTLEGVNASRHSILAIVMDRVRNVGAQANVLDRVRYIEGEVMDRFRYVGDEL